jgi:hypothetical protein
MNIEFAMLRIHVCDDVIASRKGVFKMPWHLSPNLLHHGWIYLEWEDIMMDIQGFKKWLLTSIHSLSCHVVGIIDIDSLTSNFMYVCNSHSTWNFSSLSNK